jgi:hypothetical protein
MNTPVSETVTLCQNENVSVNHNSDKLAGHELQNGHEVGSQFPKYRKQDFLKRVRRSALVVSFGLAILSLLLTPNLRRLHVDLSRYAWSLKDSTVISSPNSKLFSNVRGEVNELKHQHDLVERMALNSDELSTTLEEIKLQRLAIPWSKIADVKSVGFGSVLSFFSISGMQREELLLLQAATKLTSTKTRLKPSEVARYINFAYLRPASVLFGQKQYSLAHAISQNALERARILNVPALSGTDHGDTEFSALLIVDAFFPSIPDSREHTNELCELGERIMKTDFGDLGVLVTTDAEFGSYLSGVGHFRTRAFSESTKIFEQLFVTVKSEKRRDLSGMMLIRSLFFSALMEFCDKHPDTRSCTIETTESRRGREDKVEGETNAMIRAFVRVLLEEGILVKRGPSHPQSVKSGASSTKRAKREGPAENSIELASRRIRDTSLHLSRARVEFGAAYATALEKIAREL